MPIYELFSMNTEELKAYTEHLGFQGFRGKQLASRLLKAPYSFDEMKELPKELRDRLEEERSAGRLLFEPLRMLEHQRDGDGSEKFLFGLKGGDAVESVLMRHDYGNSLCVSSQLGCNMGCAFCASTIGGKLRNLSAGEMLMQLLYAQRESGEHISRIVVMGIGEPFDNYEALLSFVRLLNEKEGQNMGMRNITVSTCGLVPYILRFGKDLPEANLAISLHAPNDEIRSRLMPVTIKYKTAELIAACREYTELTRRRISFEYAVIDGVNDSRAQAEELSELLRGMLCHVNLIPLNSVSDTGFRGSSAARIAEFKAVLDKRHIVCTVRRSLGAGIDAACGQLRRAKESSLADSELDFRTAVK